jgi:hypothetical protein
MKTASASATGVASSVVNFSLHIGGDEHIEPGLENGNFATVEGGDLAFILVDAGDLMSEIRKASA